jgi:hypothetical protein
MERECVRTATIVRLKHQRAHEEQRKAKPRPTPGRTPRTCRHTQSAAAACAQTRPCLGPVQRSVVVEESKEVRVEDDVPAPGTSEEATTTES